MEKAIADMIEMIGLFGGMGLFFWMFFGKIMPEMKKNGLGPLMQPRPVRNWQIRTPFLDAQQVHVSPAAETGRDDAVLQELRALRQQVVDMQSTCHQFDLSFDAALSRLEERISRVEARQAPPVAPAQAAEEPQRIRLGRG